MPIPIPPVAGFNYNKANNTLSWNSLPDADNYEIKYKPSLSPDFTQLYAGSNTSCGLDLGTGTYDFSGRGEATGGGFGLWTNPPEQIVVI